MRFNENKRYLGKFLTNPNTRFYRDFYKKKLKNSRSIQSLLIWLKFFNLLKLYKVKKLKKHTFYPTIEFQVIKPFI